jgi:hypothetical protein
MLLIMNRPAQSQVVIPLTPLGADLAEAERIKQEMTALLGELEHQVAPQAPDQPGGWRHDPRGWAQRHQS